MNLEHRRGISNRTQSVVQLPTSLMRGSVPKALLATEGYLITKLAQYMSDYAEAKFQMTFADARDYVILLTLATEGKQSQQSLCEALWIDRGTMTTKIQSLEKRKLVSRTVNENERRIKVVNITALGRQLLEHRQAQLQGAKKEIFPSMTKKHWAELSALLEIMVNDARSSRF